MKLLQAAFFSAISLALATLGSARAEDAKPQVSVNEKERTATVHFGDPEATSDRFSGVRVGIYKAEVTYQPGSLSFSVKVSGYIGNGFPEDIFLRKVEPEEIAFDLSARTKGAPAISAIGLVTIGLPESKDWLRLRGRTFTGSKTGVRDDSGEVFSFTKNLEILQGANGFAEATKTIEPGVTTADISLKIDILFNRMGSSTIQQVEVTIPLHTAVSEAAKEK